VTLLSNTYQRMPWGVKTTTGEAELSRMPSTDG
jgi:hypothetical protein